MPQTNIKTTDRITVCGMPGMGKTEFCKYLSKIVLQTGTKLYVYDVLDQYEELDEYDNCERVVPHNIGKGEFEELCRRVWTEGNATILAEEVELYLPEKGSLLSYTAQVAYRGRNRGIGVIGNTRRIADFSKKIFSLCDHVFVFRSFSPNDVKYIGNFFGKQWEDKIRGLKPYYFLHYHAGEVQERSPIKI